MTRERSIEHLRINMDPATVDGFGDEWSRFDQSCLEPTAQMQIFDDYFSIFPWDLLPEKAEGADIGCGSGRWAKILAPKVESLTLVDASESALNVARKNLSGQVNVKFEHASVGRLPFASNSLDFAYSLGVLHHVPNTRDALIEVSRILKPGAPFLLYLYYAFDNRHLFFRFLWRLSDLLRKFISQCPHPIRYLLSQVIAYMIYLPLARFSLILEKLSIDIASWPLSYYRDKPLYVLRTDALDRFGTRLEQRFTKEQIRILLEDAGFTNIRFSSNAPFWCAVGIKE